MRVCVDDLTIASLTNQPASKGPAPPRRSRLHTPHTCASSSFVRFAAVDRWSSSARTASSARAVDAFASYALRACASRSCARPVAIVVRCVAIVWQLWCGKGRCDGMPGKEQHDAKVLGGPRCRTVHAQGRVGHQQDQVEVACLILQCLILILLSTLIQTWQTPLYRVPFGRPCQTCPSKPTPHPIRSKNLNPKP
eukprot:365100-Chlamydomonas_euryale.AAC.15